MISKQETAVVSGVPIQVVCIAFSSHILVVVTQLGKMGTLVSVEPSSVTSDIGKPVLTTKVLLGKGEPLIHVFAKNLVAFVSQEAGNSSSPHPGHEGQEHGGGESSEGGDPDVPGVVTLEWPPLLSRRAMRQLRHPQGFEGPPLVRSSLPLALEVGRNKHLRLTSVWRLMSPVAGGQETCPEKVVSPPPQVQTAAHV